MRCFPPFAGAAVFMNILWRGPLVYGGTCRQRLARAQQLGLTLFRGTPAPRRWRSWRYISWSGFGRRLLWPRDLARVTRHGSWSWPKGASRVLWVDKGLTSLARSPRTANPRRRSYCGCHIPPMTLELKPLSTSPGTIEAASRCRPARHHQKLQRRRTAVGRGTKGAFPG